MTYYYSIVFLLIAHTTIGQTLHPGDSLSKEWSSDARPNTTSAVELRALDSTVNHLTSKIDSLERLHLPTTIYQKKLDSVAQCSRKRFVLHNPVKDVDGKLMVGLSNSLGPKGSLQSELDEKTVALQKKLKRKTSYADSLARKGSNIGSGLVGNVAKTENSILQEAKLPGANMNLPNTNVLGKELNGAVNPAELNSINKSITNPLPVNSSIQELKKQENISLQELSGTNITKSLNEVGGEEQKLTGVEKKGAAYTGDVKKAGQGDIQQAQAIPKEIENTASTTSELKQLKTESAKVQVAKNALQQYQESMSQLAAGNLSSQDKSLFTKDVADHFAGQEQRLKVGIAQLDKLKRKYKNIPDSRYLPRRAPNELKGRPFKERFIPGVNFQLFKNDYSVIDLSPFAVYRLTTRIRSGLGWTYRLNIDDHQNRLVHERRADGFRAMTDFRVIPNLWVHGEYELMNFAPYNPLTQKQADPSLPRKWIPGLYLGILKTYKISRLINGNFQALYNLKYEKNGLYPSKINLRFGFEFNLNKKKLMFVPAGPAVEK